jgi:hypothetical protein
MVKQLSLTNSEDIVCHSVHIINGDDLQDIFDVFLLKTEAGDIVEIPPDTLNTLQEIADAINNDPNFFQTINNRIG